MPIFSSMRERLRRQFLVFLSRSRYKRVWESISQSETEAKLSVAGFVEEESFASTGQHTRDMLQACVGIKPTDVVLEIGAGVGRVGRVLAPICKEWIGADVSRNMLTHIQKRLAEFPNVRTVELNGFDLSPVPSESIDVVYCTVVFMHLDEWERYGYIAEGMRVLKKGGRMLVDNINLASEEGWTKFLHVKNSHPPLARPANISKSSTPEELRIYFQRAGFQNIQQKEDGIFINTYGSKGI